MMSMQSRTKKSTLVLFCCLALAGLASCSGGGSGGGPMMRIYRVGSIPDQTVAVGRTATLDVGRYFRDANSDKLTYHPASGDTSVATVTVSGSVVSIRGLAAGTATVRVTARVSGKSSAYQDFDVQVQAVARNRAPEAVGSIPDQTVAVGGTRTWNARDLEPYFRDPDDDTLSYTFAFVSGESLLRVTSDGSDNELTIRGLAAGTATVRVTARDPGRLSAYQDFDVQVQAVARNRAPEAVGSIPDQTVAVGGTRTWNARDLERYFRDPDGDTLTYTFAFVSGASLLRVTSDGSGNELTVRGLAAGTARVRVTATDPGGLTARQDLEMRVQSGMMQNENLLDDVRVTIPSSCPREVQICVHDYACEDGDIVRVSVNGNRLFERELFKTPYCVPVPVLVGTNSIELFAVNTWGGKGGCEYNDVNTGEISINGDRQSWRHSGGRGSRANLYVNIGPPGGPCFSMMNISPQRNRPPSIRRSISDIALTVGENKTIDLSSYFTDPDGDTLSYIPTLSSGGERAINATVSGDNLRIRALAAPGATIRVTARDPGGLTEYQDFVVRVQRSRVYGSIAFGKGVGGSYSIAYKGSRNSAAAARSAAVNSCNSLSSGITCSEKAAFSNSCAAVARSDDDTFFFVWNLDTRSDAERVAVNDCRQDGKTGCNLLSSDTGDGRFSVCYGT